MVVHPALRGFSRSANNVVCSQANLRTKSSDSGLAWVLNTKKGFISLSSRIEHIPLTLSRLLVSSCILDISFLLLSPNSMSNDDCR